MMSRRNTFPSLSSSRQIMMAWKVSGLSQSPAIMASRPASIRLAMAISPSRERSSAVPISRIYMRTGPLVRSERSFGSALVVGDIAALLGAADQLLDRRVGKVEQGGLGNLLLQHLFLLRRHLDLACHESPQSTLS